MVFVVACFFMRKENPLRLKTAWTGLSYALLYIVFTLVNKYNVHQHFEQELNRQNIRAEQLYTSPSLFNNFLWAGIASTNDSIWLGNYSIMQKTGAVKWVSYPRNTALIKNWPDKRSADVLQWFSQGKYFVQQDADTLKFYNVKWGGDFREGTESQALPFYFMLYPDKGAWRSQVREPHFTGPEFKAAFKALWHRMFNAS
jgi:inner membrane protein